MELTKKERLILANQFRILEQIDPKEADFYQKAYTILQKGYALEYDSLVEWFHDDLTKEECREVIEILEMHSRLDYAYRRLGDKTGIDEVRLRFRGFDGNNETGQMSYADFLIHREGKWRDFASMDLNSHCPTLDRYRRMLGQWRPYVGTLELSREDILRIIGE